MKRNRNGYIVVSLFVTCYALVLGDLNLKAIDLAVKTPSAILFIAANPIRWAPQNKDLHYVVHDAMTATALDMLVQAVRQLERVRDYVC